MQSFRARLHPAAVRRARQYLRYVVRWSSAKDLENCPAEAEVEQAYEGDHKQHKDQHDDEVVDQLRPVG